MLVEDSIAVRKRLREILDDIDRFRIVGEFDTAEEAIVAMGSTPPDVVLLDIQNN